MWASALVIKVLHAGPLSQARDRLDVEGLIGEGFEFTLVEFTKIGEPNRPIFFYNYSWGTPPPLPLTTPPPKKKQQPYTRPKP